MGPGEGEPLTETSPTDTAKLSFGKLRVSRVVLQAVLQDSILAHIDHQRAMDTRCLQFTPTS